MHPEHARKIIRKNFIKYLDREPGNEGLNHYVPILVADELDETGFINEIKHSIEYNGRINLANLENPWKFEKFGSLKQITRKATSIFRRLPDFLIIGAPRSGTSALYDYLIQHEQIQKVAYKELHFFSKYYHRGVYWYRSFFPTKNLLSKLSMDKKTITGEATPTYLHYPHAAKRIHDLIPNVKLIILLRNPIDRAYSHHQYRLLRSTEETLSFEESFEREQKLKSTDLEKMFLDKNFYDENFYNQNYFSLGIYWEQIERWFKFFQKTQILIIDSEKFFSETKNTMNKIYDFLELPQQSLSKYEKIHSSGSTEKINSNTRKNLSTFFDSHNKKLYEIINQNFNWK